MRFAGLLLIVVVACGACKKRPKLDHSTPEKGLQAFFDALNKERFPGDLEHYVSDPKELQLWRFRCKQVGCASGTYKIVSRGEVTAYRATFYIDFIVYGTWNQKVSSSERSPVTLERDGDKWYVAQFGERKLDPVSDAPESPPMDAAAPDQPPPPADAN